jgi:hypothetical protein
MGLSRFQHRELLKGGYRILMRLVRLRLGLAAQDEISLGKSSFLKGSAAP